MVKLTKQQRATLFKLYARSHPGILTPFKDVYGRRPSGGYRQFRRQVLPYVGGECVIVPWAGMFIGIEQDGYAHS